METSSTQTTRVHGVVPEHGGVTLQTAEKARSTSIAAWLRTVYGTDLVVRFTTGCCLGLLVILVFAQVITRYFFRWPIPWVEEVAGFLFVWSCCLGASLGLESGAHARIDVISNRLGRKGKALFVAFGDTVTAALLIVLIVAGTQSTMRAHNQLTASLELPWSLVYAAWPIGMLLLLGQHIRAIIKALGGVRTS